MYKIWNFKVKYFLRTIFKEIEIIQQKKVNDIITAWLTNFIHGFSTSKDCSTVNNTFKIVSFKKILFFYDDRLCGIICRPLLYLKRWVDINIVIICTRIWLLLAKVKLKTKKSSQGMYASCLERNIYWEVLWLSLAHELYK